MQEIVIKSMEDWKLEKKKKVQGKKQNLNLNYKFFIVYYLRY